MNSRIKELIDQATFHKDRYALPDEFAEKFAELIVRQCADWIVDNSGALEHLGPEYFAKAMTKDFGVEE